MPPPTDAAAAAAAAPPPTEDALLGGRLRFLQPARGYRVAVDPVLLAAATAAEPGEAVLDAGAGSGAASLCLAARVPGCRVTGLEREPELLALARANVAANGLEGRVGLAAGDLLATPGPRGFDRVMTNPPFHAEAAATAPATATGRAAHLLAGGADLAAWIGACLARLRPRGWLTLVHRADRLDALLAALAGRAGDVRVCPVWPRAGRAARRVLVAARRDSKAPACLLPGLVLHEADGRFTPAADAILRDGAPLPLHP